MSKVYDPILCMLVEKKVSKARDDSKGREVVRYVQEILKEKGLNNSVGKYDKVIYGVRSILGQSILSGEELKNIVRRETERLLKKYSMNDFSTVDRAIRAIDAEKGYELDGFWIKPNDYGVEVTKNGKKVGEFDSTSEAEKWIRGEYGD